MRTRITFAALAHSLLLLGSAWAQPMSPVYVYQGSLNDGGQPFTGTASFTLQVFDAVAGGTPITSVYNYNNFPVTNGLFQINVNMGADVFNDEARYLQLTVNGVTQSPRQLMAYAPRALQVRGIDRDDATGFLGIGRDSRITGSEIFGIHREAAGYGGMYVSTGENGQPFYGYSIDGSSSTFHYVEPADGDWRLYNNGQELKFTNLGNLELNGNIGIGSTSTSPFYPLEVRTSSLGNAIYAENSAASSNTVGALASGSSGVAVLGTSTGTFGRGVKGTTNKQNGVGVEGEAYTTSGVALSAKATGVGSTGLIVQATGSGSKAAQLNGFVATSDDLSVGTNLQQNRLFVRGSVNASASPSNHVALIENTTTGTSPDVMALKINSTDLTPGSAINYITFFNAASTSLGSIQGNSAGGVELAGPGNDYAEWLEQESESEAFAPGDVVAVRGGKISLDTRGADQTMVVSTSPIVTGNRPFEDDDGVPGWQKIAFVGQAPVRVLGPVRAGDFLIPSGLGDGTAVAASAGQIDPDRLTQVLGVAWESSQEPGVKRVKAAIGVDQADANAHVIRAQRDRIDELSARLDRLEQAVERLSPAGP